MVIFPAIDIKDGTCVRLFKGDFGTAEKVAEDPLETALSFKADGAEWIHMVDLDGALEGERKNSGIFLDIAARSGLKVELGGGIRTMKDISFYIENGISRVILGSAAITNPKLVEEAVNEFGGDSIAVGIDARGRKVMAQGWTEESELDYIDLAKRMDDMGVNYIIYTDIDRDGTLSGVNISHLLMINKAVMCNIIASGGINNIEDIKELGRNGIYGAICGKSLYKGTLSLKEAVEYSRPGGSV